MIEDLVRNLISKGIFEPLMDMLAKHTAGQQKSPQQVSPGRQYVLLQHVAPTGTQNADSLDNFGRQHCSERRDISQDLRHS